MTSGGSPRAILALSELTSFPSHTERCFRHVVAGTAVIASCVRVAPDVRLSNSSDGGVGEWRSAKHLYINGMNKVARR
jgi:hypothetical protein